MIKRASYDYILYLLLLMRIMYDPRFIGSNCQSVNINFEDRNMTLAALIDIIPEDGRDTTVIYRVKPVDLYDSFNRKMYIRKRYIAVRTDGFSICSCLQGSNLGILCRHQLAVINKF